MWAIVGSWFAHSFSRFLSVLVYILIFAGLVWCVYVAVVRPHTKPNPTSQQKAQDDFVNFAPRVMFGCINWKLDREAK